MRNMKKCEAVQRGATPHVAVHHPPRHPHHPPARRRRHARTPCVQPRNLAVLVSAPSPQFDLISSRRPRFKSRTPCPHARARHAAAPRSYHRVTAFVQKPGAEIPAVPSPCTPPCPKAPLLSHQMALARQCGVGQRAENRTRPTPLRRGLLPARGGQCGNPASRRAAAA